MRFRRRSQELLILEMEEVGSVRFVRSKIARNLNIRITTAGGVRVSVPRLMSLAQAQQIVRDKQKWIVKHLRKLQEYEKSAHLYDGSRELRTRGHRFQVKAEDREDIVSWTSDGLVSVHYPLALDLLSLEVQTALRYILVEVCRAEAKAYLPGRLAELSAQFGFSCKRVFIKNHKARWGSCSSVNNINLSLHLMRLPDEIIDYVILHELVHTEIKNHSHLFWSRLAQICPDVDKLRKMLRQLERDLPR